jgi:natural product precursor
MSKKKFNKKLVLNKTTIAHLEESQLDAARGGATTLCLSICYCYKTDNTCTCPLTGVPCEVCVSPI